MNFSFTAGAIYNEKIIFSHNACNGLFEADINSWKVKYIRKFPGEDTGCKLIHRNAIEYNGKLWFFPNQGNNIHEYNPLTGDIRCISIPKTSNTRYVFSEGFEYNDKLYLFPGNLEQPIIVIDPVSFEIRKIDLGLNIVFNEINPRDQFFYRVVVDAGKSYMVKFGGDSIINFDLDKETIQIIRTGLVNLHSVQKTENSFWITTQYSGVYEWNTKGNSIEQIVKNTQDFMLSYTVFQNVNDSIYFIPDLGGVVLTYTVHGICQTDITIPFADINRIMGCIYDYGCQYENDIILFPVNGGDPLVIHNNQVDIVKPYFTNSEDFFENKLKTSIMEEGKPIFLDEYLDMI